MIDFMRYKWVFFLISALVLVPGVISLVIWRLNPSVDFTGGTLWEVKLEKVASLQEFKGYLEQKLSEEDITLSLVQKTGERTFLLKLSPLSEDQKETVKLDIKEDYGDFKTLRFETVGALMGKELLIKTLIGIILAAGFILFYVAWRFKNKMYGVCAILAMFHDTLIVLGIFSLLGHFWGVEVDILFVTAILTVLSFSVHDTVVVYDRIRELRKLYPKADFTYLVNQAISETLVRSLNNSLTIIFMLLALLLLGGTTIRWFVVALLIGTIAGTYSSTFTAAPLLVVWYERTKK
ncbi:protein translocase subunit SecF [candidate division CPR3 bacterium 4484_211]|uniref:Protein-export membrane protein SecF n=1 Tax=candidate division CPR3 bacterium 4484_211 TaxID=1968527 RepID=A0A1W9NYH2_UNCC3|nr:MAG: protein translocase subunit SecF [candidate division CPR3 bacterium 4484_211]